VLEALKDVMDDEPHQPFPPRRPLRESERKRLARKMNGEVFSYRFDYVVSFVDLLQIMITLCYVNLYWPMANISPLSALILIRCWGGGGNSLINIFVFKYPALCCTFDRSQKCDRSTVFILYCFLVAVLVTN